MASGDSDIAVEARLLYEDALARLKLLKAEWEQLGSPVTAQGGATGRAVVVHPLIGAIERAERNVDQLAKALGPVRAKGGRPEASASAPDRRPGNLRAA